MCGTSSKRSARQNTLRDACARSADGTFDLTDYRRYSCKKPRSADHPSGSESRCPQAGVTNVCCFAQLFHAVSVFFVAELRRNSNDGSRMPFRRRLQRCRLALEQWQAEGHINRLKTIKRAMYGGVGPELIRARMMPVKIVDLCIFATRTYRLYLLVSPQVMRYGALRISRKGVDAVTTASD